MKWVLPSSSTGFTLVELVMVIVLIGALSALGIGLFARSSSFSPMLATQQLESATLLAQQAALAGNSDQDSLSVTNVAGEFRFTVGTRDPFTIEDGGTTLNVVGATFPITFDHFGRPVTGGNTVRFTFSGESTYSICLSPLGAVYRC
ncbi:Tfp pilus assembly protein FimT/FimU [Marinobacter sp. M1N3S26]|uniref:pilus assembly FimT family protein n=1 Tax=Marinobacter sp. M1N3S26 TaxID=3382299 RepID=UPI00387B8793